MLSSNACSSAQIPRQILLDELPALPDIDVFVTHVYDVAKVCFLALDIVSLLSRECSVLCLCWHLSISCMP